MVGGEGVDPTALLIGVKRQFRVELDAVFQLVGHHMRIRRAVEMVKPAWIVFGRVWGDCTCQELPISSTRGGLVDVGSGKVGEDGVHGGFG